MVPGWAVRPRGIECNEVYFLILEKSERRLLFPLIVPDLVLSEGDAQEIVDIVSGSSHKAFIHDSIEAYKDVFTRVEVNNA